MDLIGIIKKTILEIGITNVTIRRQTGEFRISTTAGEKVRAYLPRPLPPDPPVDLSTLYPLLDKANQALGRLDGSIAVLPDRSLFLYFYVRKEAVVSSQIEGTQSTLSQLLLFEKGIIYLTPYEVSVFFEDVIFVVTKIIKASAGKHVESVWYEVMDQYLPTNEHSLVIW